MNKRQKKKFKKKSHFKKYRVRSYWFLNLKEGEVRRIDMKNDGKNKIRYACMYTGCTLRSMDSSFEYKEEHDKGFNLRWKAPSFLEDEIVKRALEHSPILDVIETWMKGLLEPAESE